jgi:hypothetical protein
VKRAILAAAIIWTATSFSTYQAATEFLNRLPDDEAVSAKLLVDPATENVVVIYPFENPCCTGQIVDGSCHQVPCPHNTLRK